MKLFPSLRWFLLALLLSIFPASSYAGVFISVGFAPPMLPVYDQPPCPEPGLMWTPGYWAYGPDGYYWVPGAWVPAPYYGALWTPPYWGWSGGLYVFHSGYWGRHVGYYGGVNYGYGYGGIGFVGGMWRGHDFEYNTAVMHVDRRYIHSTYEDRRAVDRGFVDRGSRVAYSGGPGGIRHQPGPGERLAERDQHMGRTSFQQQHMDAARNDRSYYFKNNNGRPANPAFARPLGNQQTRQGGDRPQFGGQPHSAPQTQFRQNSQPQQQYRQQQQSRPQQQHQPQYRQQQQSRPQQQARPQQQSRPAPQQRAEPRGGRQHR